MSVVNESWTTSRNYPHPPERVFAAWADPAVKVRWFDLSDGCESNYRSEFQVGGRESVSSRPGNVVPPAVSGLSRGYAPCRSTQARWVPATNAGSRRERRASVMLRERKW